MLPFSFQDLRNFSQTSRTATLNCALGRYTTQQWRGAALQDVLEHAATGSGGVGVPLESLTDYAHSLLMNEARDVLLAAHAGDELLGHWHGAPAACQWCPLAGVVLGEVAVLHRHLAASFNLNPPSGILTLIPFLIYPAIRDRCYPGVME